MKKMLLATMLAVCATGVWAEGAPLACQDVESGGLYWENGKWKTTKFHLRRFVLVLDGDTLTKASVSKAMSDAERHSNQVTCTNVNPQISCANKAGAYLYFDPRVNLGGIARIIGATGTSDDRDTLSVEAFTCQPF